MDKYIDQIHSNEVHEESNDFAKGIRIENDDYTAKIDFTSDYEKMLDFERLSKSEFLESYSYLSEREYDATQKKLSLEGLTVSQMIEKLEREMDFEPLIKEAQEGTTEYFKHLIDEVRIYHPEKYGFDKDDKIHIAVGFSNKDEDILREDDFYEILQNSDIKFMNRKIDWNPVDADKWGNLDAYFEKLEKNDIDTHISEPVCGKKEHSDIETNLRIIVSDLKLHRPLKSSDITEYLQSECASQFTPNAVKELTKARDYLEKIEKVQNQTPVQLNHEQEIER